VASQNNITKLLSRVLKYLTQNVDRNVMTGTGLNDRTHNGEVNRGHEYNVLRGQCINKSLNI
jgi:hypothetical protein